MSNTMAVRTLRTEVVALLLLTALVTVCSSFPTQKQAPIIAVVVEPWAYSPAECVSVWSPRRPTTASTMHANANSSGCVWSVYVKWLEASGIRVLPLRWNVNTSAMNYILDRVNGVLFPGGIIQGDDPVTAAYFKVVQYIFHRAVHVYNLQHGDRFVVWGTCQGFELLNAAAAGSLSVIEYGFVGVDPKMLPLIFLVQKGASDADRMYDTMSAELKFAVQRKKLTLNWHQLGVVPASYDPSTTAFPSLPMYLMPLTTSVDDTGRVFVSSMQGRNDSIRVFATQYHPERPPVEFDNDIISHTPETLDVSHYLSLKLRVWLAESDHAFDNATEADGLLIANYPSVNQGWGVEVYYV